MLNAAGNSCTIKNHTNGLKLSRKEKFDIYRCLKIMHISLKAYLTDKS